MAVPAPAEALPLECLTCLLTIMFWGLAWPQLRAWSPPHCLSSRSAFRRHLTLVRKNELSKGPSTAAVFCEDTFAIVEMLHPPALAERPIPAALLDLARTVPPSQASADSVATVLRKMRRGVAPRVSGLTNDHLKALFPTDTDAELAALDPLVLFVNKVLAGDVCEGTADWLFASKLVTLLKHDGAGGFKKLAGRFAGLFDLRPIAIPETLYRLVALCGLALNKTRICAALTSFQQLCVGVPSACEGITAAVRLYLEQVSEGGASDDEAGENSRNSRTGGRNSRFQHGG